MNINKHLIISGIVFTVILFLWPIFMALSQPTGTIEEQFQWINDHLSLSKIQFFFAFLISPSIIYLMIVQLSKVNSLKGGTTLFGIIFLIAYLVIISISYASQMTILPNFIENEMMSQAKAWYFGSFSSIPYFLNQTGYCFFGIGAIILYCRFLKFKGIIKYLSIIYLISGVLSIVAFFGLVIDNETVNKLTVISGLVLVPVGILTIVWGFKESKKQAMHISTNGWDLS